MNSALEQHRDSGRLSNEQFEHLTNTLDYAGNLDRLQRLASGGNADAMSSRKVESHISGVAKELNHLDPTHPVTDKALNSLKDNSSSEPLSFYRSAGEMKQMLDSFHSSGRLPEREYNNYMSKLNGIMGQEEGNRQSGTGMVDAYQERELNSQVSNLAQEVAGSLEP